MNTPTVLQRAFLQSDILRSNSFHWSYYRDVVNDINSLFSSKIRGSVKLFTKPLDQIKVTRNLGAEVVSSATTPMRIHLQTNSSSLSHYQLRDHSVALECVGGDVYTFTAFNRFICWDFIKSLRRLYYYSVASKADKCQKTLLLHQLHYSSDSGDDEECQGGINFSRRLKVVTRHESGVYLCRLQPSSMRLSMININSNMEAFYIPLDDNLKFLHISSEHEEYRPYDIKLNIISADLPRDTVKIASHLHGATTDDANKHGIGHFLKDTSALIAETSTAVASSIISVIIPSSPVTKIVVNFPNASHFETHDIEGFSPFWDDTCHVRVRLPQLYPCSNTEGNDQDTEEAIGIIMHLLFVALDNSVSVLGSRLIPFSDLIQQDSMESLSENSSSTVGGLSSTPLQTKFDLNSDIKLHVRVLRGENLLPPENTTLTTNRKPRVKVSFATKERQILNEYMSYR